MSVRNSIPKHKVFFELKDPLILGIDPGTVVTGFGLITIKGNRFTPVDFGCIRPPKKAPAAEKYLAIFDGIEALITNYEPTAIAVETQFVYKNVQTALKLGMARGSCLIAGAKNGIPIYEYAPSKAKQAVVGKGIASKLQVQKMIQALLALSELPEPEDAADALALAICHAHNQKEF